MKARLVVVSGGAESSVVNLELPVVIGRGRRAGVLMPHSSVSRQHCELYDTDGKLTIRDLGSMNGTFVNQQRITTPTYLRPGDTLKLGSLTFRAEYGDNEYRDSYATQTDAKDETAIGQRYDPEQLRKAPVSDSLAANAVDDKSFAADELEADELEADEFEDVERLAILPTAGPEEPLPATVPSTWTESTPLVSDDRSDAVLRKRQ